MFVRKAINLFLLGVSSLLLISCGGSGLQPLTSNPPAKKIRVNEPFQWGDGIIFIRLDMPKGDYLPKYEDKGGYYYEAPQKITGRDSFWPLLIDGGLYLDKNALKPEKIYMIRNQYGIPHKLKIKKPTNMTVIRK